MASTVAAQTRDFARRFFAVVTELGREDWVSANQAFERTIMAHPDHPYVAYIRANRARKAGFSAAAERIRQADFPQIDRRKTGTRRNAPVFYRVGRPDMSFSLELPYEVPPSHPLRTANDAPGGSPLRHAPAEPEPRSPWRVRQGSRRTITGNAGGSSSAAAWWQMLVEGAGELLETVSKAISKVRS